MGCKIIPEDCEMQVLETVFILPLSCIPLSSGIIVIPTNHFFYVMKMA